MLTSARHIAGATHRTLAQAGHKVGQPGMLRRWTRVVVAWPGSKMVAAWLLNDAFQAGACGTVHLMKFIDPAGGLQVRVHAAANQQRIHCIITFR